MKVGDLVYVAYPTSCCGRPDWLGETFIIGTIREIYSPNICCGKWERESVAAAGPMAEIAHGVETLRVIPPLNELEAEKAVETVNA